MSKTSRTRQKKKSTPKLVPLQRERTDGVQVYCELHKGVIAVGEPVAWWPVKRGNRTMKTAYCSECHHACVRAGRPLQ